MRVMNYLTERIAPLRGAMTSFKPAIGLIAILCVLPIEVLVVRASGHEPYPALFQPSFGTVEQSDSTVKYDFGKLTATTVDGEKLEVDPYQIMPSSSVDPISIWSIRFGPDKEIEPDIWLGFFKNSLTRLYPHEQFAKVTIEWYEIKLRVSDQKQVSKHLISSTNLDFGKP